MADVITQQTDREHPPPPAGADAGGGVERQHVKAHGITGLELPAENAPGGAVGAALMRSRSARLYHDHMLTKEPGTRQRTPWHQDQPYYNIDGRQGCSFWIPVDAVSRESTLEFVAGSHLGPWLMPRSFRDAQARWSMRRPRWSASGAI